MTGAGLVALSSAWSAEQYVAATHETVRHLVALDVRAGGDQTSRQATRALRTALRRWRVDTAIGPWITMWPRRLPNSPN